MSLEKKIKDVLEMPLTDIDYDVKQCVQICDEFAVGFAEWHYKHGRFIQQDLTTTELLEIYKQGL